MLLPLMQQQLESVGVMESSPAQAHSESAVCFQVVLLLHDQTFELSARVGREPSC